MLVCHAALKGFPIPWRDDKEVYAVMGRLLGW